MAIALMPGRVVTLPIQLSPPSVVLKTLSADPAYKVVGVLASIVRARIGVPAGMPTLEDRHVSPPLVVLKTPFPVATYNVSGSVGAITSSVVDAGSERPVLIGNQL